MSYKGSTPHDNLVEWKFWKHLCEYKSMGIIGINFNKLFIYSHGSIFFVRNKNIMNCKPKPHSIVIRFNLRFHSLKTKNILFPLTD